MQHQLDCWERQKDVLYCGIGAEMGAGKGKIVADQVAYLYDLGRINALVVIAPKGGYSVWPDDVIPKDLPDHIRFKLGVWSANMKAAEQAAVDALFTASDEDLHILVMNVEALGTERARKLLEKFLLSHTALLAVDESTCIKNPTAARTKAVTKLGRLAKYRRALSGEPAPDSPMDWYSQCDFLKDGLLGYDSFFTFKSHFARLVRIMMPGRRPFHKIDGFRNEDELKGLIARHWFIVKKEDCLDLPPKIYTTRSVEMGPLQRRAYEQMRDSCLVDIAGKIGDQEELPFSGMSYEDIMASVALSEKCIQTSDTGSTMMTAQLVITQMLRLHQILCGFAVTDDRVVVPFDEPNPRMEELMTVLEQVKGKVIIWATYKVSVKSITERIGAEYGAHSVVSYFGETSTDDRRAAVRRFQDPNDPCKYFVANKTGARALTLTQAKTVVYYSCDYDADIHNQSQDRAHRIGQTGSVTYVYLQVPGTADQKVIVALRDKKRLSDLVTPSNWREFIK